MTAAHRHHRQLLLHRNGQEEQKPNVASTSASYPSNAVITTTTTVDTTKSGKSRNEQLDDGRLFDIDGFYDTFFNTDLPSVEALPPVLLTARQGTIMQTDIQTAKQTANFILGKILSKNFFI